MDKKVLVFDIQKFSVHDGPGIRTIVFFKGCPLHCQWCANPESQGFAPELLVYPDKCIGCGKCVDVCEAGCFAVKGEEIIFDRSKCIQCCRCAEVCYAESRRQSGKFMTLDEIKEEVDKDMVFYKNSGGGITFSGGEAMCFPEAVKELAKYYKKQGVSTAIETCGYASWENYQAVLPYLDLVMFDLKILDDEKHKQYTGGSNARILENVKKISKNVKTVIRIPIVPTVNDAKGDIDAFGAFISGLKPEISTIHILPYHNFGLNKYYALGKDYPLDVIKAPSDEHMNEIKAQLEDYGFTVVIGG